MGFLGDMYAARGRALSERESGGVQIIGDKAAYMSPLDRTVVEGRTAHREHMARHGVMEAGDMKVGEYSNRNRNRDLGGVRQDYQRALQELNR